MDGYYTSGDPRQGDVFREYVYYNPAGLFLAWPPEGSEHHPPETPVHSMYVDDLKDAIKAEVAVEYVLGHIGTSDHRFSVNKKPFVRIPKPVNLREPDRYYWKMYGRPAVEIPLEHINEGLNDFQFATGPQIYYNFNWPLSVIHSFIVRIYYDPAKKLHPEGEIISPASGGSVTDAAMITLSTDGNTRAIRQVHFIGYYRDFNWEGDGIFEQWHYALDHGRRLFHIGSTDKPSRPSIGTVGFKRKPFYSVIWDAEWVPDFDDVRVMACLEGIDGIQYMTPAVEGITLKHTNSVKMYRSEDVPERFGVRAETTMKCTIDIPHNLNNALEARLYVHMGFMNNMDEIRLNGKDFHDGIQAVTRFDNFYTTVTPIPISLLKQGVNEFEVYAKTDHHANEIVWPGPVIMVKYHRIAEPSRESSPCS